MPKIDPLSSQPSKPDTAQPNSLHLQDTHDFELVEDLDFEIISQQEIEAATKFAHRDNQKDILYYMFILFESIFLGNIPSAIAAMGHISIGGMKEYGSDVPKIFSSMITSGLYVFKKSAFIRRMCGIGYSVHSQQYRSALHKFAENLNSMLSFLGAQNLARHAHIAHTAYEGLQAVSDLTDHRKLLYWFLRTLRDELIRQKIWPTV